MDESSQREVDAVTKGEKARAEIKRVEKKWIQWASRPSGIRADHACASAEFGTRRDQRQIKLKLMPRDAHHRFGILERNYLVPRGQIAKHDGNRG